MSNVKDASYIAINIGNVTGQTLILIDISGVIDKTFVNDNEGKHNIKSKTKNNNNKKHSENAYTSTSVTFDL